MDTTSLKTASKRHGAIAELPGRLSAWLRKKDSVYRNMERFSRLDAERLRDIGITPQDRDLELERNMFRFGPEIHR